MISIKSNIFAIVMCSLMAFTTDLLSMQKYNSGISSGLGLPNESGTDEIISEEIIFYGTPEEFSELCDKLEQADSKIIGLKIGPKTNGELGQGESYYLGASLIKNKTLLFLDLSGLLVDGHTAEHLGTKMCCLLRENKDFALQILNLSNLPLGIRIGDSFKQALEVNKSLKKLYLDGCSLGDDIIGYIARGLKKNLTLEVLGLSRNRIGETGAQHLADSLRDNASIKTIDLSANQIGDGGAIHFGNALFVNDTIEVLILAENNISLNGASGLMIGFQNNNALVKINLENNKFTLDEFNNDEDHKDEFIKMENYTLCRHKNYDFVS